MEKEGWFGMRDVGELLKERVSTDLADNVCCVEDVLGGNADLIKREFVYHEQRNLTGIVFFVDGLVSPKEIDHSIMRPLTMHTAQLERFQRAHLGPQFAEEIKKHVLTNTGIMLFDKLDAAINGLLSGDTVLFLEGCGEGFLISTRGWEARSIDEPTTEPVVRGPRDGFTENIRTNTALMRRRIRDANLKIESLQIGDRTRTDINVAYIKGVVREGLVEEVHKRLQSIRIDGILESGYIEELIEDAPLSPFTTIQSTERPDKVASSLLEGRVAIFVDNTPFVLIMPTTFWQFLQASDDFYSRYWAGSFFRLVRFIAFFISLTFPSMYVMLVSFHQEMIPTALALSIAAGRESVPFPALLEAMVMEVAFELMREAGLRMPRPVGQAVSIVGSLVVGQAAVQAGLVSPTMVIVVAITGISSFAIPNYAASFSIRVLRFPLLLASGALGLLGFAAVFSLLVLHALSLRSFGQSYLSPATPFQPFEQQDLVLRMPIWMMNRRPAVAGADDTRMGPNQMPAPPDEEGEGDESAESRMADEEEAPNAGKGKRKGSRPWRSGKS